MSFRELKRHLDKPDQVYICDLVARGDDWVILSYVSDRSWTIAGTELPAGSETLAFYQAGTHQVLWRMMGPDRALKGHLFHLCRDIVVEDAQVSYQDLLLDVWVSASGATQVLDREDVAACRLAGKVSDSDLELITSGEIRILAHWPSLVGAFDEKLNK